MQIQFDIEINFIDKVLSFSQHDIPSQRLSSLPSWFWRGVILVLCMLWATNFAVIKDITAQPGVTTQMHLGFEEGGFVHRKKMRVRRAAKLTQCGPILSISNKREYVEVLKAVGSFEHFVQDATAISCIWLRYAVSRFSVAAGFLLPWMLVRNLLPLLWVELWVCMFSWSKLRTRVALQSVWTSSVCHGFSMRKLPGCYTLPPPLFFFGQQDSEHLLAEGLFASCRMRQLGGLWLYWSGSKDAVSYHGMVEAQVGS